MKWIPAAALLLLILAPAHAAIEPDQSSSDEWGDWDEWGEVQSEAKAGLVWTGFVEGGLGARIDGGDEPESLTLGEARMRLETQWAGDDITVQFKGDAWYDGVPDEVDGELRELTARFRIGESIDVSLGQQVLTWGTGDLVFLNDLFPKDFQSFFAGRDDEYLKVPSAALRVTHYGHAFNTDFVWSPVFQPDRYLTGERFSFYLPPVDDVGVPVPRIGAVEPSQNFANGEFALRFFARREATEYAAYAYRGFYKQPLSITAAGELIHSPLSVYGASVRRPLGRGVVSSEVAWYDSRDDRNGDDPAVPNSQARWVVGYERELMRNWQLGVQYYVEWTAQRNRLRDAAPPDARLPDEWRALITARVTGRLRRDTLTLSMFIFASPTDKDVHLRPQVAYRLSDAWTVSGGGNLFYGDEAHTFFGQLEENDNVFLRVTRFF